VKVLLLVEDDDMKARALQRMCRAHGIETVRAVTVVMAVNVIRNNAEMLGAVLTDWQFPFREDDGKGAQDGAGRYVYEEARKAKLPVAVCSGRDAAIEGVEPWIRSDDIHALNAWLNTIKREPELVKD